MAGNRKMHEIVKGINDVGEDKIFGQMTQGWTTDRTCQWLKVGKRAFYKWLRSEPGRQDRYYAARKIWADHLAEETLEIADSAKDPADAAVRKLRIDTRKWLAASANPDNWGDRRAALVNVNIQDQHIEALRELSNSNSDLIPDK